MLAGHQTALPQPWGQREGSAGVRAGKEAQWEEIFGGLTKNGGTELNGRACTTLTMFTLDT